MKISTSQYYKTLNEHMNNQQAKIAELQSQLSTGKKNVTPSTDVKATTSSLKISTVISAQKDYINTLKNINAGYAEEEIAMSSMTNMIRRMQDIAIAGANQTYSQSELNLFANEVQGYIDDVRGLANTKDSNGHYIFSGTETPTMSIPDLITLEIIFKNTNLSLVISFCLFIYLLSGLSFPKFQYE